MYMHVSIRIFDIPKTPKPLLNEMWIRRLIHPV
jgi:hypothetical protein